MFLMICFDNFDFDYDYANFFYDLFMIFLLIYFDDFFQFFGIIFLDDFLLPIFWGLFIW